MKASGWNNSIGRIIRAVKNEEVDSQVKVGKPFSHRAELYV